MLLILRMDNHAVTHVECHMAVIADDIAGSGLLEGRDRGTHNPVRGIIMRQTETKVSIDSHDETGTIGAMGQTGAAPDIRIADILSRKLDYRLAGLFTRLTDCYLGDIRLGCGGVCSAERDLNYRSRCLFISAGCDVSSGLSDFSNSTRLFGFSLLVVCTFLDVGIADTLSLFPGGLGDRICHAQSDLGSRNKAFTGIRHNAYPAIYALSHFVLIAVFCFSKNL